MAERLGDLVNNIILTITAVAVTSCAYMDKEDVYLADLDSHGESDRVTLYKEGGKSYKARIKISSKRMPQIIRVPSPGNKYNHPQVSFTDFDGDGDLDVEFAYRRNRWTGEAHMADIDQRCSYIFFNNSGSFLQDDMEYHSFADDTERAEFIGAAVSRTGNHP